MSLIFLYLTCSYILTYLQISFHQSLRYILKSILRKKFWCGWERQTVKYYLREKPEKICQRETWMHISKELTVSTAARVPHVQWPQLHFFSNLPINALSSCTTSQPKAWWKRNRMPRLTDLSTAESLEGLSFLVSVLQHKLFHVESSEKQHITVKSILVGKIGMNQGLFA